MVVNIVMIDDGTNTYENFYEVFEKFKKDA